MKYFIFVEHQGFLSAYDLAAKTITTNQDVHCALIFDDFNEILRIAWEIHHFVSDKLFVRPFGDAFAYPINFVR